MARADDSGVSVPTFLFASLLVVVAIGALVWFAVPGPGALHRFVSPSGRVALELGEACGENGCQRAIVSEETAIDGSSTRRGCIVPLTEPRPVLINAHPLWSADERSVEIVHTDAEGVGGKFTLSLGDDCRLEDDRT